MPRRPNIPSLFGIKLSVAVDFLCPTFKNKLNDTLTRDHFQLPIQAFSIVGDRGITTGNFILYNFAQCKVRHSKTREFLVCGIRNLEKFYL